MTGTQVHGRRIRAAWPGVLAALAIAGFALALMTMTAHAAEEEFNTPGMETFTVPGGVTSIVVEVWGGGGGGGGVGGDSDQGGGGGGGGGGYVSATVAVSPGDEFDVVVGNGGAGGGAGEDGDDGGTSSVTGDGASIAATGGAGGGNGVDQSSGGDGGAGGTGSANGANVSDDTAATGGTGADGDASAGGDGGDGAGDGGDGGPGGAADGNGGAGSAPGGGGGGGGQEGLGGDGANGRVRITFEVGPPSECGVAAGTLSPSLAPSGVTITIWGGGNVSELPAATSYWTTHEGELVGYIPGAPVFVNATFIAEIGADVPACTGFIVRT